ncbi:hypothetical protein C8R47DRAFT_193450 [Mycena vitilis]|nr:hypothetical protein C8R47DRAFT_193450 [Mycena vitilis]
MKNSRLEEKENKQTMECTRVRTFYSFASAAFQPPFILFRWSSLFPYRARVPYPSQLSGRTLYCAASTPRVPRIVNERRRSVCTCKFASSEGVSGWVSITSALSACLCAAPIAARRRSHTRPVSPPASGGASRVRRAVRIDLCKNPAAHSFLTNAAPPAPDVDSNPVYALHGKRCRGRIRC